MKNIIIIVLLIIASCSSGPVPKDTVFDFIDAVKLSDSLQVVKLLDIDAYIKAQMSSMSPEDSAKVLVEYRTKTIQSLLGNGEVRSRWLDDQIVVNTETRQDSFAEVEVSFINKATRIQLYTKMQLRQQPDRSWRITYFTK
jgi:hypothetical protein